MSNKKTKKKIIIGILIVLILLLTISTSQAAGTFTQLNANITATDDGETLTLNDNYTNTDNQDITINKNITINGQGHIINFNTQNKHILIVNGNTVTLKNIILINGNNTVGGAIQNNGTLTLENTTFTNNTATNDGGAIENYANLNIINSTFTNNTVTEYNGGAIHNAGGAALNITGSTFNNNTANGGGGAIYNNGIININNSILTFNTANGDGGAIVNVYNVMNIIGSTFTLNTANGNGRLIYNYQGTLTVHQSVLMDDTDDYIIYNDNYNDNGGSVVADGNYWGNKNPTADDLVNFDVDDYYLFKINSDKQSAYPSEVLNLNIDFGLNTNGLDPWTGPDLGTIGDITFNSIANATITQTGNTATFNSSTIGIYTVTATSTSTLVPPVSTKISVRTILNTFYDLNTEIQNNLTAGNTEMTLTQNYTDDIGFQIIINGSIIIHGNGHTLNFNQQNNNNIKIKNSYTVTLKNIILINGDNTIGGSIQNNGTLTLENTTFTNNTATNDGGAIENYANLNIINSTFTNNTVTIYNGGAIHNAMNAALNITGSTFTLNTAMDGGAIYNDGNLNINNSTFNQNTARTDGGAIYNTGALTINNSTFNQNTAEYGGAIYNTGALNITGSTFTLNTAMDGGAIYNNCGDFTINNSTFNQNTATWDAGAIFNDYGDFTINNSKFNQNTAEYEYGGAIYNNYGDLTINNSTFTNNTAWTGGAIYNDGNLNITTSTFNQNTAEYGGAIYNSYGNLNISQSVLVDNSGNTIYIEYGIVVADGNYWGNLNPTTDNLVNFNVDNYYCFLLTGVNSTVVGSEITLTSVFGLNTTNAPWIGPTLNTAFSSNPNTATLTPTGDTVKFKASTAGSYTVTASKAGGNSTITITVKNPTPIIKPTTITSFKWVKYGSKVRFTATVKSGSALVSGVIVRFTINGKPYNVVSKNGQAIITTTLTKSINTIYAQTIKNTQYSASARRTLTVKLANLKTIKITRKNNRYYIYVKNYGKATSAKTYLRLYYKRGKKTYSKTVTLKAIKAGKTLRVTVNFYRYSTHRKYYKYAYVNYKTRSLEYNYKDNQKKFRR